MAYICKLLNALLYKTSSKTRFISKIEFTALLSKLHKEKNSLKKMITKTEKSSMITRESMQCSSWLYMSVISASNPTVVVVEIVRPN